MRDSEKVNQLAATQVAAIELPINISTGYRWEVSQLDPKLQVLGSEIIEEGNGLLGAPARQIFYVAGANPGMAEVQFQHLRPFMREDVINEARFSFQVEDRLMATFSLPEKVEPPLVVDMGISTRATLPASYNWCDQGGCTPVKDQGQCGGCWAFSTVGAFESALLINDKVTKDLSEQYLISCNDEGWGCNGGFFAHDYHISKMVSGETAAGGVLESTFPYTATDKACNPPHAKVAKLQSWTYIVDDSSVPTTAQIKQAIYDHGPISVAMCANTTQFNDYTGGIYTTNCTGIDHAVILVGWNDTDGAWVMRNSWGSSWGENGYMRIKYGVGQIGYAANYVVYQGSTSTPKADFNSTVNGLSVTFADASTDTGSTINAWSWTFGDNATSTAQNPSHTYAAAGTYTVTLKVTDANSQTNSISKSVSVSSGPGTPKADFSFSASGLVVTFSDASTDSGGTINAWSWTFGDNATSTTQNPSHTYAAAGTYTVTLKVTDNTSQSNSTSKSVTVTVPPATYCTANSGDCSYEWIAKVQVDSFTNSSTGQTYTDFTSKVITMAPGSHTVTLTPGFGSGSYTEYFKVWIDLDQNADFTGTGEAVFSASGKAAVTGTITIPSSAKQGQTRMRVAMRYNAAPSYCGAYDYGEVEDYTVNITGGTSTPTAAFTDSISGLKVTFTDASTDTGSTISSWKWNFGDGSTSTTQSPSHTYASGGTYTVSLTVTDANSQTASTSKSVTVSGGTSTPVAGFNFSASGLTVTFTDSSTDTGGTINSWSWNFGDSKTSTSQNPSHAYAAAGTYSVTLTVTDNNAQSNSISKNVTVQSTPASYCASGSSDHSYEWISKVKDGTYSNSSTGSSYSDFTSKVFPMTRGNTYTITLTPGFSSGSYTEYFRVWIDLNGNGDFTGTGETVFSASGKAAVSGSVTIPTTATPGQTRMRVAMRYGAAPPNCGTYDYGETEDYTVNIQ